MIDMNELTTKEKLYLIAGLDQFLRDSSSDYELKYSLGDTLFQFYANALHTEMGNMDTDDVEDEACKTVSRFRGRLLLELIRDEQGSVRDGQYKKDKTSPEDSEG